MFLTQPFSFDKEWMDHNADCYDYTVDEKITMATYLTNVGPVIRETL